MSAQFLPLFVSCAVSCFSDYINGSLERREKDTERKRREKEREREEERERGREKRERKEREKIEREKERERVVWRTLVAPHSSLLFSHFFPKFCV